MKQLKTGALIAVAVGGLFGAACKKEDKSATTKAAPKADPAQPAVAPPTPTPTEGSAPAPTPTEAAKPDEKTAKVDCGGVNECKGKSTCKTDKHGCAGQNGCKGQGVLEMTEDECKTKGGTITARK